jgi:hypothetical protein
MTDKTTIQNWNATTMSKHGTKGLPTYLRGILLQWESASGHSKRILPFEPFLTTVNGIGPSNNRFSNLQTFGTFSTSSSITNPVYTTKSKMLRNLHWIWSNQPQSQKVQFSAIVPGIFMDTYFPEDMEVAHYGPLVSDPDLAKLVISTTS